MQYAVISFDDNTFFDARITNNDMVYIERYSGRNPLSIFSSVPPLGDLAFILYMSLRRSSSFTLDDIYNFIDDNDLNVTRLANIVIQLFRDMGYVEEEKLEKPDNIDNSPQPNKNTPDAKQEEENKTFKQIADSLLKSYLLIGTSEEFWNSNLEEVTTRFDRHKKVLRSNSEADYMLAMMIASNVGMILNGKGNKMRSVEDFFPHLYDEEEIKKRENEKVARDIIDGFAQFANRFHERKKATEGEKIEVNVE